MWENIKEELEYIIEKSQIKSVFQPIISLRDGHILGYEALSRITCKTLIQNTEILFQLAGTYNRLWDLELLCRMKSLEAANVYIKPPYDKKLFINVNPKVMHDKKFRDGFTKEFLTKYDIMPENIIFEITERNSINDMDSFKGVVNHYKKQQYQIAVDDAGAGYSGLNLISEIHPHYIKLDMNLIRNIDKDNVKYALVKSMLEFSHLTNINLIAEGIETEEELKTLVEMGVHYGQGYLIQKPDENMKEIDKDIIDFIKQVNSKKNHNQIGSLSNLFIGNISTVSKVISPTIKVENVYDGFREESNIHGVCIVDNNFVLGIITRENITLKLSGRYGFSLFQKKPISAIMDTEFLSVDYYTPISSVSYLAMGRVNKKLYDIIVVTKDRKYYGVVTVKDLLQKATEIDIENAKSQNPLSGLPGNMVIEQKMNHSVNFENEYSIAYIDIDNFKAYNDVYGFEKGDMVIKGLSKVIVKQIGTEDFAGHIGGDDFVVIFNHYNWQDMIERIIKTFEKMVLEFYNEADKERGYIETANRKGKVEKYPIISLTVALLTNKHEKYSNTYEVTEKLARLKKIGKQQKGSYCYVEE